MGTVGIGLRFELAYGLGSGLNAGLAYGLSAGLNAGLSAGLAYGLSAGLNAGLSAGLSYGWLMGVSGGLLVCAVSGDWQPLQHYVLRLLLWRTQTFPWKPLGFWMTPPPVFCSDASAGI